jgi:uncharacterized lipoprotein
MDAPLQWNALHAWKFQLQFYTAKFFLLRDHVTLAQDFTADWNSRPQVDFDHFIPYAYKVNIQFKDTTMHFCVNEINIISQPNDFNENCTLLL